MPCASPAWHPVNIFSAEGADPREAVDLLQEPALRPIGHIPGSTAFLVSPCHALAAYHGVFGFNPPPDHLPDFELALPVGHIRGAERFETATATPVLWGNGQDPLSIREDWALLHLTPCIGRRIGWLDLAAPESAPDPLPYPVTIAGYPNDRPKTQLWRDPTGLVEEMDPGLFCGCLLNSAATVGGNSGSPLFELKGGIPVVVGLQVRVRSYTSAVLPAYNPQQANIAVDARLIVPRIEAVLDADKEAFWQISPERSGQNPAHPANIVSNSALRP
jgi:V8-like Glu-specific endopeptidase